MKQPILTLTIIYKDAESFLYKDEILKHPDIVPVLIQAAPTETEDGVKTGYFKWEDHFGKARQYALDQVKTPYVAWIDADDTVDLDALVLCAKAMREGSVDWVLSPYEYARDEDGTVTASQVRPRVFRTASVKWEGRIHENPIPTCEIRTAMDEDLGVELRVRHNKNLDDVLLTAHRNLKLLQIAAEEDPGDLRIQQYLGRAYMGLEQYEKAVPYFLKQAKGSGMIEDSYWSLICAGQCLTRLGDLAQARTCFLESLKIAPSWKDAYIGLGVVERESGAWDKALTWLETALDKDVPNTVSPVNPSFYTLDLPLELAHCHMVMGNYLQALECVKSALRLHGQNERALEARTTCVEALELEQNAKAILRIGNLIHKTDRKRAKDFFDVVPSLYQTDPRIHAMRSAMVPPRVWPEKSVVIYCGGNTPEPWAPPSIFKGIGGSEEAVIYLSKELAKQGYEVTVYNRCVDMEGEYDGVTYKNAHEFSMRDTYNTLIAWRIPAFFDSAIQAKKKVVWLHDIVTPEMVNERCIKNTDLFLFLSEWHRNNLPDIPEEKVCIVNNGIVLSDHKASEKRPYSLIWSSSYDRGLLPFMKHIFPIVKERMPQVTLDVAYGWNNIQREMDRVQPLKDLYEELAPMLESTEGVTHHGRLSHRALAKLMGEVQVYPYASEFGETNNITSQKCQASGVYVLCASGAGGTPERVHFGAVVPDTADIYTNEDAQQRFAAAIILALTHQNSEKRLSPDVDLISQFDWSVTAQQFITNVL